MIGRRELNVCFLFNGIFNKKEAVQHHHKYRQSKKKYREQMTKREMRGSGSQISLRATLVREATVQEGKGDEQVLHKEV